MRIPRVFVAYDLVGGERLSLPAPVAAHLVQVRRLRDGDELLLFNGDGHDYPGRILQVQRGHVLVEIGTPGEAEPLLALRVHLGIGVSKGERMDFALQKSVELGVAHIAPLFTGRGVVNLEGERLERRHRHWQRVVESACEQSGRRRLPTLAQARTLDHWLTFAHPCALLLDPQGLLSLAALRAPTGSVTLLVGPEGGLTEGERGRALQAGFTPVRLGPRILRAETAPLAALAAAQTLWGDFLD